jgi:hypothetical protein
MVRVSAAFTNSAGTAVDPTEVYFEYKDPDGIETLLTYGTDAALVRDSAGNYHVDVDADTEGGWYYRWYSTGTGQTAAEGSFGVNGSQFV